ncbi:MAG: DUF3987 domain-containing protein, partial [Paludibacteraceae bacterium]|nr:DUF3987 domain-containing protein [Paludibacteraceae bacterium]
ALRKAAEHEAISRNRCTGASEIKCPKMSMLLTGTFNQYRALVPSVENGYFSRLLTLVIRETHPFDKRYVSTIGGQSAVPQQAGRELLRVYERLSQQGEHEWSLTEEQKTRLGEHLETEYGTLIGLLGDNFHSAVVRMAVQIERIALILTALRMGMEDFRLKIGDLRCSDEDYQTAVMIGNKLLLHMAAAYQMIDGDSQELVPEIQPLDQRKVLYNQLPNEYQLNILIAEAKSQGISRRSAIRWNNSWQENGLVTKVKYGLYQKVG